MFLTHKAHVLGCKLHVADGGDSVERSQRVLSKCVLVVEVRL